MRIGSLLVCAVLLLPVAALGQEASYLMRGDQLPVDHLANGYVQSVTPAASGEVVVRVATALWPIGSRGSYGAIVSASRAVAPPDFPLPARISSGLCPGLSAWQAATNVLGWVDRHLRLDDDDAGSQDARSVLRRGGGRCSGLANATVALLLTAGFEARTISGLLVDQRGATPHRWLECRLPGAGWVPTDPTLGLWAITPQHVAFAGTVASAPRVVRRWFDERLDDRLRFVKGRSLRLNRGSDLVCRLVGEPGSGPATAVLRGPHGEVRRAVMRPQAELVDLSPGRWRLEVEVEGVVIGRSELELREGQRVSYAIEWARCEPS